MSEEIDKKALKKEINEIKDAMGLKERYPSRASMWLWVGAFVGIACLLSQIVAFSGASNLWYPVIWFGGVSISQILQKKIRKDRKKEVIKTGTKPSNWIPYLVMLLIAFVVIWNIGPLFDGLDQVEITAYTASTIFLMMGAYYFLMGNQLKAYYIRKKDRNAFYVGGGIFVILSAVVPHFYILQKWMWTIYGIAFLGFSLSTYYVLSKR